MKLDRTGWQTPKILSDDCSKKLSSLAAVKKMDSAWITDDSFESILQNPKYTESCPISVRAIVSELSDIDTSTQTFVVDMKLIYYVADVEDVFQDIDISFPNMVEKFFETASTTVDDSGREYLTQSFRAKFKSLFQLQEFPFDYQQLSIMYE